MNDEIMDIVTLKYVLDKLGYDITMDTFDDRLILQKKIYLLQEFGLPLGYDFSWYIHGPYCSKLAKIGTTLDRIKDTLPVKEENFVSDVQFINNDYKSRFKKFIKFLSNIDPDDKYTFADKLEILASIHILYVKKFGTKEEILDRVVCKKDYFEIEECKKAWNLLEREGFITYTTLSK